MTKEELLTSLCIDLYRDSVYNIFEKLDNYKSNLDYPRKPKFPKLLSTSPSIQEIESYKQDMSSYEIDLEKYVQDKIVYDNISNTIVSLKEEIIREESGLNKIPEQYRDKVYDVAYRSGHSSGYLEVYNKLVDLVEIFE